MRVRYVCIAVSACLSLQGCLKGGKFLKQNGGQSQSKPALLAIVIEGREDNGGTVGSFSSISPRPQFMSASQSSAIAGTTVSFPAGSLVLDTDVTLKNGENLATPAVATQLSLGTEITASAAPVSIASSTAMDTANPFTLAIPVPTATSLQLAENFANLIVIYHVRKVGAGDADFTGILTRDKLSIHGSTVSFETSFFGSYQAVLTASPITQDVEVPATPNIPTYGGGHVAYLKGPTSTTFLRQQGAAGQSMQGLTGWMSRFSPSRVGGPSRVEADIIVK